VGVVGLGMFGRHFVHLFQQHPLVERLAICDIHPGRVAEIAQARGINECYASLEELLKSDLDAVAIITQPWLHLPQVLLTLEAGKHAYSAVPSVYGSGLQGLEAGDSNALLDQCDQLVQAVRRTGQRYMLGETTYFRQETMYCRQRAQAGDFGALTYGECEYWHDLDNPHSNLREVARNRWGDAFGPDKTGGIPMHYPTHSTSSMIAIMGAHMTSVSARGYVYPDDDWFRRDTLEGNLFSNEVALYRMSNGASVRHSEFRRVGHPGRESFRLFGTEACYLSDVSGARWTTREGWEPLDLSGVEEPLPPALAADKGGHGGSHAYLVHEFVSACAEDRQPRINAWEAVRYLAPGIVAHQSALRDGETLPIPDWGDAPEGS
jgi:predicted dehydrogenase